MGQGPQNPSGAQFQGFEQMSADAQNNIYFIRNEETKEERAIRKWFFQEQKDYAKILQTLKQRQAYSNRYLSKLLKYDLVVHDNICRDNYELYAVWEHCPKTLGQEIKERISKKSDFSDEEIWKLASTAIQAMQTMQRNKNIHEKLTVQSIRVNNQGAAIITDPLLLPTSQNYLLVKRNEQNHQIYLSPEEVASLQMETLCIKSNKSDVWALGLILLEVGLLQSQSQCYSQQGRKINWVKVSQNLKSLGKKYDSKVRKLIGGMLEHNKSARPSWSELRRKISQQTVKPTSVNKINQNAYLTTGESPEVLAYKSMLSEQTQIYSFSRINQFKNKNPIIVQQKQNILWNQAPMPIKFGANPHRPVVNFIKPEIRHIPIYVPIEKTTHLQNVPIISSQMSSYRPPLNLINHQAPEMKRFTSQSSIKGFLFEQNKQNQIKIVKPECQKLEVEQKRNETIAASTHKFDKQYIVNTESITYEGDFRPIFRHQTHQSQKMGKVTQRQEEPVMAVDNKQIGEQILPLQSQSIGASDKNEGQIQYVIENFQIGSRYEGHKLKNMRHGEGRFYYQDGGMYDGNWKYNKMDGKGKLYYRSGALAYDGMWKDDQFEGKGKLYNQQPETLASPYDYNNFDNVDEYWEFYEGDFINDMKQGRGKLMLSNGQYYMGNFSQDMIQGTGKFIGKKQVVKGQWQGNQLVRIVSRTQI